MKETDDKVIFMRKLERGSSEHSSGIYATEITGMPRDIVKRADAILKQLEADNSEVGSVGKPSVKRLEESREGMQLSFFQLDGPMLCQVRGEILGLDINNLTPMGTLNKLSETGKITRAE